MSHRLTPLVINAALPDSPIFTTRDAAVWTGSRQVVVSRKLAELVDAGVVTRLMRGLWAVPNHPRFSPYAVVPYLVRGDGPDHHNDAGWDAPLDLGEIDDFEDAPSAPPTLPVRDGAGAQEPAAYGAYVSFTSALHLHGMLSQIPR